MNTISMNIKTWNIEELTGYKPISTFYEDFSIGERFTESGVSQTYHKIFREWKDDYRYLTELVMVLNWKIWEHYENGNLKMAEQYNTYWIWASQYAENTLKGEELQYYYRTID